jgi:hypothetical protein
MKHRLLFTGLIAGGFVLSALTLSCAGTPRVVNQFEQFSASFLKETGIAGKNVAAFNELVTELSDYENRVGTLSNSDYQYIGKQVKKAPDAMRKMEMQTETAQGIGKSVTPDGYYASTKEKIPGWDAASYANLQVDTTVRALSEKQADSIDRYKNIHLQLFEKPDKPFNKSTTELLTEVKMYILSARSDIAAKDWKSGKINTDNANTALKNALKADFNNIEQYQINLLLDDIKDVSNKISLGSALNETGALLKTAAEGAANIWGGIGNIFKGIGDSFTKEE